MAENLLKYARQRWLTAPANMGVTSENFADIDDISVLILRLEYGPEQIKE